MAKTYWGIVNKILEEADIILQVLDARFTEETRNKELEEKVNLAEKKMIIAINKTDLVSLEERRRIEKKFRGKKFSLISVREHKGAQNLRNLIKEVAKGKPALIGVCGYPNTGKSSVINALKGAKVAKTSPTSGYTVNVQKIKIGHNVYLIDTPGVIPYKGEHEAELSLISSLSKEHIKDPESVAQHIITLFLEQSRAKFEKFYEINTADKDEDDILDELSLRTRKIKGGKGDIVTTAKRIIDDWQKGRILLK